MAITVYFICYSTYIGISKYIEICKGILECVYVCIAICNLVVQIGLSCERFVSVQTSMVLAVFFFLFLLGSWCRRSFAFAFSFPFPFPFFSFSFWKGSWCMCRRQRCRRAIFFLCFFFFLSSSFSFLKGSW